MFLQKLNVSQLYYNIEGKTKNEYSNPKIENRTPTQQTDIYIVGYSDPDLLLTQKYPEVTTTRVTIRVVFFFFGVLSGKNWHGHFSKEVPRDLSPPDIWVNDKRSLGTHGSPLYRHAHFMIIQAVFLWQLSCFSQIVQIFTHSIIKLPGTQSK